MGDLDNYLSATSAAAAGRLERKQANDHFDLDMQDFLNLMVTELKSQSIDNTADTSEMLNQMVMMQMVSALTNMTEASVMSYAASLVGKTVTIGQYDGQGQLQEIVGTVTGTGTMGGQQVVFVNDKYYYLNEIMAVGTLPQDKPAPAPEAGEAPPEEIAPETTPEETPEPEQMPEGIVPDPVPEIVVPEVPEIPDPADAALSDVLSGWN